MEFSIRRATDADREFLYELVCRTMREVIEKTWGWDEAWQRAEFDRRFIEYLVSIIGYDDRPVGGLWLESKPDSIYIHGIYISPEYQGRGIGSAVVRQLIEQAMIRRASVTLSVVPANPRAKQLYERLGFEVTNFEEPFFRMRHNPGLRTV